MEKQTFWFALLLLLLCLITLSNFGLALRLSETATRIEAALAQTPQRPTAQPQEKESLAVSALKKLESTVVENGVCVVYDDATGKKCESRPYCSHCNAFSGNADKCSKCNGKVAPKWVCKGTPTIGYGETAKEIVDKGAITLKEAEELLKKRVKAVEAIIASKVTVPLTEAQKAALVCFVYNIGEANFKSSTLLKVLNEGKYNEVPTQMRRWVFSKKVFVKGLQNRREQEIKIWSQKWR